MNGLGWVGLGFCVLFFDIGWRWWMVVGGIVSAFIVRLCYDGMKGWLRGRFERHVYSPAFTPPPLQSAVGWEGYETEQYTLLSKWHPL